MKSITNNLIQPIIIGLGSSIFLYAYNNQLRYIDYFMHIPFWITVVRPSGLFWNQHFLKQINKDVFPSQMKVYRELYLTNKNAILYDVIFNHTIYHSFITPLLLSYMFYMNKLVKGTKLDKRQQTMLENKQQNDSLSNLMKSSALNLIQGRIIISCVSILSQYWITYFSLKSQIKKGNHSITTPIKKFLLTKQLMLNWSWSSLILHQFYKNYLISQKQVDKQQNI